MKEFDEIYREYYHVLYTFLLRLTAGNHLLTEELTQETFYQAFISIHRYNGKCQFFTWLCQIAKNSYFKYLRKNRALAVDFVILGEELLKNEQESTEQQYECKVVKEDLRKAISQLNKKQQNIVMLRIYFELSFQEIGKLLGMKENTVRVNFYRAKEILKQFLS